jgi:hypothetical protein
MSALPSIEEYRDTMGRIGRLATQLRSYAADRCRVVGGLTSRTMQDAIELERRLKSALETFGLDEPESSQNQGSK